MTLINRKKISKDNGFTLIEVLVASVILFASIATVSMIYRGAFLSSEQANKHVNISGVMPSLLANVRSDIRTQGNTFESQLGDQGNAWSVQYQWQANLVQHKSAPQRLDVDTGDYVNPPIKYKLWLVELDVQYQSISKHYQFYEMSWSND
ncbi:MAG: prepilin-type N-terminal cleavage/methylation domain-containing protein [Colwellia sp.]|nr:prepilin-type N-terminal cleavage/methylation domain-containing protein [Colwellia sp.]